MELEKGPLLAEIDRLKNEAKAQLARDHVASLKVSNAAHDRSDASALKVLELSATGRRWLSTAPTTTSTCSP